MGSPRDIAIIISATLLVTISVFTGQFILQEVDKSTNQSQMDQDTLDKGQNALKVFDLGIVAGNVFFYLVAFIFAYRIRSNPVFAVPSLIILAVNAFVSFQIANVYAAFARVGPLTAIANMYPATNTMYSVYGQITIVMGAALLLFLYGKTRSNAEVTV